MQWARPGPDDGGYCCDKIKRLVSTNRSNPSRNQKWKPRWIKSFVKCRDSSDRWASDSENFGAFLRKWDRKWSGFTFLRLFSETAGNNYVDICTFHCTKSFKGFKNPAKDWISKVNTWNNLSCWTKKNVSKQRRGWSQIHFLCKKNICLCFLRTI